MESSTKKALTLPAVLAMSAVPVCASMESDATDKSVAWLSDDDSVVSISQSGKVTAVSAGIARITATTVNGVDADGTNTINYHGQKLTVLAEP